MAEKYYRKGISWFEGAKLLPTWSNILRISLGKSKVLRGDRDINQSDLFRYYDNCELKVLKGWMARSIGEIFLNIDDEYVSDAQKWLEKAIEGDRRNSLKLFLGCDYALYAELFKRKGDRSRTKESLSKAIEIFKECGADGYLKKAEKELTLHS